MPTAHEEPHLRAGGACCPRRRWAARRSWRACWPTPCRERLRCSGSLCSATAGSQSGLSHPPRPDVGGSAPGTCRDRGEPVSPAPGPAVRSLCPPPSTGPGSGTPPNPPTRLGPWEPPKVQQGTHLPLQTSTPLGHKHPGPGHLHDGSPCGCRQRPPPSTSSPGCCPGANPWLQDSRAAGSASSTARSSSSTHCAESQALALGGDSPTDPTQASCFREGLELPQGQGLAEAWAPRGQPGQEGRCGATRL